MSLGQTWVKNLQRATVLHTLGESPQDTSDTAISVKREEARVDGATGIQERSFVQTLRMTGSIV